MHPEATMILLLALVLPATAVDPDTSFYVASDALGAGAADALSGYESADPTVLAVRADTGGVGNATAALALDPATGVLYARAVDAPEIYAFDASDLTRLPSLDLLATGSGGALEIDPFRRLLIAVESDGSGSLLQAWSIDHGASYGAALDATSATTAWSGAETNHLVRDPATDALYAANGTPSEGVRLYDLSGQSFSSFTFTTATSLSLGTPPPDTTPGLALDVASQELLLRSRTDATAFERYDVSTPGSAVATGAHTTAAGSHPAGLHWVDDASSGATLLVLGDTDDNAVYVYDSLGGLTSSVSITAPGAVEFYPLDETEADDDGDGLWDSVELGATGLTESAYNDSDPSTTTDPDDPDSDDDGLLDGEEDLDADGALDADETDPADDDSDDDGSDDGTDNCPLEYNPDQDDLDGDGFGDDCDDDVDGDGYEADEDCDDLDAAVSPGATESWYDGVDQDCDGASDYDADGDGYDSDAHGGDDCDDTGPDTYPGATDHWYDGVDADCAGDSDFDMDGDGFDSASYGGSDCDDADANTFPGAYDDPYDGVVNDCDATDEYDADGDGYRSDEYGGADCDDANSDVNPGVAEEWYNGVDEDCDGNDDRDGDGWPLATDCDDDDPSAWPGAPGWTEDCEPAVDTGDTGGPIDTEPPDDTAPPEDSGPPDDTAPPEDTEPVDSGGPPGAFSYKGGGGLSCGAAGTAPAALIWLLGVLALLSSRRES